MLVAAIAVSLLAETASTRCLTEDVSVPNAAATEMRLVACGEGFPDDLLWNLDRADSLSGSLDGALARTATGRGAVVYVCDVGVMRDHDELVRGDGSAVIGAIDVNGVDEQCGPGRDPAVDPCYSDDATLFVFGHGTAVASVLAGRNLGIAPDAKLVSVYVLNVGNDLGAWLRTFDAIIEHAWDPRTPPFRTGIVNISFVPAFASSNDPQFPEFEKKLRTMIGGVARDGSPDPDGKRFVFVIPAGNSESPGHCDSRLQSNIFPAVLGSFIDGLITVGGIDRTNHLWSGSCRGSAVDILAPADDVFVASIGGRDHYRKRSGTSHAAPYVAGLVALLLESKPDLTPAEIETTLKSSSSRVANTDEATAGGRVAVDPKLIMLLPRRRAARH